MERIILTMILGNEEKIIERCLNAAKCYITDFVVCVNGQDETEKICQKWGEENFPGHYLVARHLWKNFGHNRSLSFTAAQEWARSKYHLSSCYALMLDADMVLVMEKKPRLGQSHYHIYQKSGIDKWANTRIIRMDLPWRCTRNTHEYWEAGLGDNGVIKISEEQLWINDLDDGGSKADKYERDIRLLKEDVQDDRTFFYLGRSHECIQKYTDAIEWYKKRIEWAEKHPSFEEETWYSHFCIGNCYLKNAKKSGKLEDQNLALEWFYKALHRRPWRIEPLYELTHYFRKAGHHHLSTHFSKELMKIDSPKDDSLFVKQGIYDYLRYLEYMHSACYTPDRNEGKIILNKLMLDPSIPGYVYDEAKVSVIWYSDCFPVREKIPLAMPELDSPYVYGSFSFINSSSGYLAIFRSANYTVGWNPSSWVSRDADSKIRTRNFLYSFSEGGKDLKLVKEIVDNPNRSRHPGAWVLGQEDVRLFRWGKKLCGSCTAADNHWDVLDTQGTKLAEPDQAVWRIMYFEISLKEGIITNCKVLPPLVPGRTEKNWLPWPGYTYRDGKMIVDAEKLTFLWGFTEDNLILYDWENKKFVQVPQKIRAGHFRNSAGPIEFERGWLVLIHHSNRWNDNVNYRGQFIWLDSALIVRKISPIFVFCSFEVEFNLSMQWDNKKENILVSESIFDKDPHLLVLDPKEVRKSLQKLEFE